MLFVVFYIHSCTYIYILYILYIDACHHNIIFFVSLLYTHEFYFYLALRLLRAVFHLRHFDRCGRCCCWLFFFCSFIIFSFIQFCSQVFSEFFSLFLLQHFLLVSSSLIWFTTCAYVSVNCFRLNQQIERNVEHKWKKDGMPTTNRETRYPYEQRAHIEIQEKKCWYMWRQMMSSDVQNESSEREGERERKRKAKQ